MVEFRDVAKASAALAKANTELASPLPLIGERRRQQLDHAG